MTSQNLQDIREAVFGFPTAVKSKFPIDTSKLKSYQTHISTAFTYEFSTPAQQIFNNHNIELGEGESNGVVHITHSVPFDKTKTFVEQQNLQGFRKAYLPTPETSKTDREEIENLKTNIKKNEVVRCGPYIRNLVSPGPKVPLDTFNPKENTYAHLVANGKALPPMSNLLEDVVEELKIYQIVRNEIQDKAKQEYQKDLYVNELQFSLKSHIPPRNLENEESKLEEFDKSKESKLAILQSLDVAKRKIENTILCLENRVRFIIKKPGMTNGFVNTIFNGPEKYGTSKVIEEQFIPVVGSPDNVMKSDKGNVINDQNNVMNSLIENKNGDFIDEKRLVSKLSTTENIAQFNDLTYTTLSEEQRNQFKNVGIFPSVEDKFQPLIKTSRDSAFLLEHRRGELQTAISQLLNEKPDTNIMNFDQNITKPDLEKVDITQPNQGITKHYPRNPFVKGNLAVLQVAKEDLAKLEQQNRPTILDQLVSPTHSNEQVNRMIEALNRTKTHTFDTSHAPFRPKDSRDKSL